MFSSTQVDSPILTLQIFLLRQVNPFFFGFDVLLVGDHNRFFFSGVDVGKINWKCQIIY